MVIGKYFFVYARVFSLFSLLNHFHFFLSIDFSFHIMTSYYLVLRYTSSSPRKTSSLLLECIWKGRSEITRFLRKSNSFLITSPSFAWSSSLRPLLAICCRCTWILVSTSPINMQMTSRSPRQVSFLRQISSSFKQIDVVKAHFFAMFLWKNIYNER